MRSEGVMRSSQCRAPTTWLTVLLVLGTLVQGEIASQTRPISLVWVESNSTDRGFGYSLKASQRWADDIVLATNANDLGPRETPIDEQLSFAPSGLRAGEGLVLTVTHPSTGAITFTKTFPLGLIWGHFLDLKWHIGRLQAGSIVCLAVSSTGMAGLRDAALTLQTLGSVMATHLVPTSHWVWVFVKGGRTILETAVLKPRKSVSGHAAMYLTPFTRRNISDELGRERWEFCQTQEALGPYCDPTDPAPVRPMPHFLKYTDILDDIPVLVTGGNRVQYLYETLSTLIAAPGLRKDNLRVLIGDTTPSVLKLLKLMDLKYILIPMYGEHNSKLFQYYRATYQYVADFHQNSPAAIFLDEDVQISPDFFSLMSQAIPLLAVDPTLYCVTGFAGGSTPDFYGKKDKLKRVASQVLWGYALTMRFINEALQKWPTDREYSVIYDLWMYDNVVDNRECVYPEVTRTRHFGAGMNTQGFDLEKFFLPVELVTEVGIRITNVQTMQLGNWRRFLHREIQKAIPLVGNPCEPGFFHNRTNGTYVFYYSLEVDDSQTYRIDNYFRIGECANFWAMSDQGWHEAVTLLRPKPGVDLYLMGVPVSPYSKYKKPGIEPWDTHNLTDKEFMKIDRQSKAYYNIRMNAITDKMANPTYMLDMFTYKDV